jgi:hypothetical protein
MLGSGIHHTVERYRIYDMRMVRLTNLYQGAVMKTLRYNPFVIAILLIATFSCALPGISPTVTCTPSATPTATAKQYCRLLLRQHCPLLRLT